jgi:hypothetical protein
MIVKLFSILNPSRRDALYRRGDRAFRKTMTGTSEGFEYFLKEQAHQIRAKAAISITLSLTYDFEIWWMYTEAH